MQAAGGELFLRAHCSAHPTLPDPPAERDETRPPEGLGRWAGPQCKLRPSQNPKRHTPPWHLNTFANATCTFLCEPFSFCTLSPPSNARPRPTACTLLLPRARNKQGVSAAFSVLVLIISFISILLPLLCSRTCW